MEQKNNHRIIYISAYTLCLIFPPLVLVPLLHQETRFWTDWWLYLPLWVAGIIGTFLGKRAQNLIFLFQIPVAMQVFFTSTFVIMQEISQAYYIVVTTILYCALFFLWHEVAKPLVNAWQMLGSIIAGFLYIFLYVGIVATDNWEDLVRWIFTDSFPTDFAYLASLALTALLCHMQNNILKGAMVCALIVYIFAAGFRIAPAILRKLDFGTFSGRMNERATLVAHHPDHTTETFQGYQVFLLARGYHILVIKQYEGLAAKFHGRPIDFSILSIRQSHEQVMAVKQMCKTLHVRMPLYSVKQEDWERSPLKANTDDAYIAIFKNDTLIYKGEASPTDGAARFLAKELQPDREEEKHAAPQ